MPSTSVRFVGGSTAVLLASLFGATVAGQQRGLFAGVESPAAGTAEVAARSATSESLSDTITLRRRVVTIDFEMLGRARASAAAGTAPSAAVTLNLFDDVVLTGMVERIEPTFSGGWSVSGRIAGEPLGTMTLVVNGQAVAGTVRTLGGTYRIRWVGDGMYAISEVDLSRLPAESEPLAAAPDSGLLRPEPR